MRAFILFASLGIALSITAETQAPPPLLARPPQTTLIVSGDECLKYAISHPKPNYPSEARRRHLSGKGHFHLHISYNTGEVTSVEILTSTGHRILDEAALHALKRWKFRPHTLSGVKIPITFRVSQQT